MENGNPHKIQFGSVKAGGHPKLPFQLRESMSCIAQTTCYGLKIHEPSYEYK